MLGKLLCALMIHKREIYNENADTDGAIDFYAACARCGKPLKDVTVAELLDKEMKK